MSRALRPNQPSTVTILLTCALGLLALIAVAQNPSIQGVAVWPTLGLGAFVLLQAWRNYRFGITALILVAVLEGAVRKWILPAAADYVYFYKDLVMVAILAGYVGARKPPRLGESQPIMLAFGLLLAYLVLSFLNPSSPHLLVSLLGLKVYCLYFPLAFLVPAAYRTEKELVDTFALLGTVALFVSILAFVQFSNPDSGAGINRYVAETEAVTMFQDSLGESYARVTGTFSYISGLGVYLPLMFALLLALTGLGRSRQQPAWELSIHYVTLAAVVAASFMTGSRGAVLTLGVVAVVFLLGSPMKAASKRVGQMALVGCLVLLALTRVFPQATDALYTRAFGDQASIEEGARRLQDFVAFPTFESAYGGLFGYGIGSTQNLLPALESRLGLKMGGTPIPIRYESEAGRVILELGFVGFALHTMLRFVTLVVLWRASRTIRSIRGRTISVAVTAAMVVPLLGGGAVVSHTMNVFQWFFVGCGFAVLYHDRTAVPGGPQTQNH